MGKKTEYKKSSETVPVKGELHISMKYGRIPLNFNESIPLKKNIFPYFFIAGSKEIFAAVEEALIKNTCTGSLPGGHHSPENCDPQVLHSFPPQRPENSQVPFHNRGQKVPLLLFSLKGIGTYMQNYYHPIIMTWGRIQHTLQCLNSQLQ